MIKKLDYPKQYLNLEYTLTCGQAFRWMKDAEDFWAAPVGNKVIRIREAENGFEWEVLGGESDESLIRDYFLLDEDVPGIYRALSENDDYLKAVINQYQGLRLVRQDPEETLLSFVCSTANSVPRITRAIEGLSKKFGRFIVEAGGREYYTFPAASILAQADPVDLPKTAGLAWRGQNIAMVARQLIKKPQGWLHSLRKVDYSEAKAELMTLRGIGAKIADCVCLFSLDMYEAVPVDTHIRQVAERLFLPEIGTKTITTASYNRIVKAFQDRYGQYAGWAQQFLYYEDLLRIKKQKATLVAV